MTLIDRRICSLPHDASYLIPVTVRLPNATHTLYLVIYRVDEWRRNKEANLQTLSYRNRYFSTSHRIDPRSPICRCPFHSALHSRNCLRRSSHWRRAPLHARGARRAGSARDMYCHWSTGTLQGHASDPETYRYAPQYGVVRYGRMTSLTVQEKVIIRTNSRRRNHRS